MLRRSVPPFVLLILAVAASGCGGTQALESQSVSAPNVDAAIGEWQGGVRQMDGKDIQMGVAVTDTMLYVAVTSNAPDVIRAAARRGLIVWVDPAGGKEKAYGIQYPLRDERARNALPANEAPQMADQNQLAILQGERRTQRPAQHTSGLRAAINLQRASMVYELAIPVASVEDAVNPDALKASLGSTVGVGVELPDVERSFDARPPSTARRGGVTGRVDGSRRRGRQRQRQQQQSRPNPVTLSVWATVTRAQ